MRNIRIRKPVRKGIASVPVIMQLETLECGAACLAMVLAYYRKWVPLEQVRADCGVSRNGSNMKNIFKTAQHYGLETHAYRMEIDALRKQASFPCIIHWNFNHFVVLCGFTRNHALLNDPARGVVKIPMEEFSSSFTGMCMTFEPGENFVPSGRRKSMFRFAAERLKGVGSTVAFIVVTSLIAYLFEVISPVMSRIFFDKLLTDNQPKWAWGFITVMAVLAVFQIIVEWERTVYSLKINGKMAIEGSASFMWKLLHLPLEFYSQRMIGDIMQRHATNATISGALVTTVGPLIMNTFMIVFYLFVMIRYSTVMTIVGLITLILNVSVANFLSAKRININRVHLRDAGKLAAATLAGINMTETIKCAGAEAGFFRKWSGYQASVNTQRVKFTALSAGMTMLMQFIRAAGNYLVLFMGIAMVMQKDFTLGMIVAFQGLFGSFMGPASSLIKSGQTIQEMRTQMERVDDVMKYPDDPIFKSEIRPETDDYQKLSGDIEINHLSFGYSRLGEPQIKDFSLRIRAGSRVAIVGKSGCGKSTLSKLITGLYQPWEGEILFGGKPLSSIPRCIFTGSVAMVDQDIVLFEDTISNNIRMWDESIEDFEVILAARDAQIHEEILRRPDGYQNRLTENGRDLSGGQRQRLEIARALAQDPSILILDEATSALDARTEFDVVRAVKNRGITCIVIAHRLSTICDCDEIIVLDKGRIAERGTHEELYAKGGIYAELVTAE